MIVSADYTEFFIRRLHRLLRFFLVFFGGWEGLRGISFTTNGSLISNHSNHLRNLCNLWIISADYSDLFIRRLHRLHRFFLVFFWGLGGAEGGIVYY